MKNNKPNIALLLGDPSGIGPELISKLLERNELDNANILVIGEKQILEDANAITGKSQNLKFIQSFKDVNFDGKTKFFLDISKGKNYTYERSKCTKESGKSVLNALNLALDFITLFILSPLTDPGQIAFTLILYLPSSIAKLFVNPIIAHLLAA